MPLIILFALTASVGCQQSASDRLSGTWRGRPDSAGEFQAREAERKAKQEEANKSSASSRAPTGSAANRLPTDLESFEFEVLLKLESGGQCSMQLVGSAETLTGTWQVVQARPNGATIEITKIGNGQTEAEPASTNADSKPDEAKGQEKRRFDIEYESDSKEDGFRLKEVGADPQFGQIYFSLDK